jgi:hypothetical protein
VSNGGDGKARVWPFGKKRGARSVMKRPDPALGDFARAPAGCAELHAPDPIARPNMARMGRLDNGELRGRARRPKGARKRPEQSFARLVGGALTIAGPEGDAAMLLGLRLAQGRPEDADAQRWVARAANDPRVPTDRRHPPPA